MITRKMKMIFKRAMSVALSTAMVMTSTGWDSIPARATEDEEEATLLYALEPLNGQSFLYGTNIMEGLKMSNGANITDAFYLSTSVEIPEESRNGLDADANPGLAYGQVYNQPVLETTRFDLLPGEYYLLYQADDGTAYLQWEEIFTVVPGEMNAPGGVVFEGSVDSQVLAKWNAPTLAEGYMIPDPEFAYEVTLSKKDTELQTTFTDITVTEVDCTDWILENGLGEYVVTVEAMVSNCPTGYHIPSSEESEAFSYRDTESPVDVTFAKDMETGKVYAGATDEGSGVQKYAFSNGAGTESEIENWSLVTDDDRNQDSIRVEFPLTQSGDFYFHVMDAYGNRAVSENKITVSGVHFANYSKTLAGTLENTAYVVAEDSVDVTAYVPTRTGYDFLGWYASESDKQEAEAQETKTAKALTSVAFTSGAENYGKTTNVYAAWKTQFTQEGTFRYELEDTEIF